MCLLIALPLKQVPEATHRAFQKACKTPVKYNTRHSISVKRDEAAMRIGQNVFHQGMEQKQEHG